MLPGPGSREVAIEAQSWGACLLPGVECVPGIALHTPRVTLRHRKCRVGVLCPPSGRWKVHERESRGLEGQDSILPSPLQLFISATPIFQAIQFVFTVASIPKFPSDLLLYSGQFQEQSWSEVSSHLERGPHRRLPMACLLFPVSTQVYPLQVEVPSCVGVPVPGGGCGARTEENSTETGANELPW